MQSGFHVTEVSAGWFERLLGFLSVAATPFGLDRRARHGSV
jgi:hypothetical protein